MQISISRGVTKKHKCPICGHIFYVPWQKDGHNNWVFRKRGRVADRYVCSLSCYKKLPEAEKLAEFKQD